MSDHDDDLVASKTEGFKLGEKKTIEEYTKLGMLPHRCMYSAADLVYTQTRMMSL